MAIIDINNIYNMDCLDGMRLMIKQGVKVDCVITDPPYLIDYKTNRRKDKEHKFCKVIQNDNNPQLIIDLMPLLFEIMKDNTPLYMFCGSDKIDFFKKEVEKYFTVKNIIVWDKGTHTAGDLEAQYGKRYEFIIYANKGRALFNVGVKRDTDIWRVPRITGNEQIHQNQKPVNLISKILNIHTKQGDLIFDPFMGSGTTAVACYKLQRNYVGFELDKEYFKMANNRIDGETAQLSIFDEIQYIIN